MKYVSKKKKQISYINACIWNLENGTDEPVCRTGIETQVLRTDLWTQQGKEGVDRIGQGAVTCIHRHVWNRQPLGSPYIPQEALPGALWWRRGVGWDDIEREGGSRGRGHMFTYGCMAEIITTLSSTYLPIENEIKNRSPSPRLRQTSILELFTVLGISFFLSTSSFFFFWLQGFLHVPASSSRLWIPKGHWQSLVYLCVPPHFLVSRFHNHMTADKCLLNFICAVVAL